MTNQALDNYYERQPTRKRLPNGRWIENWKQPLDEEAEDTLLKILKDLYHPALYVLRTSEHFSPLDIMFVSVKTDELIGVAEVKRRNTPRDKYNTVPLNLRKVEAFQNHIAKGIASIYFVMWSDYIGYIDVRKAVTAELGTIGTKRRVKSDTDMNDPCHLIPKDWFTTLCKTPQLHKSGKKQTNTRKR